MKIMQIGDLKTHFSDVIARVKNGEKIIVSFGKKKEKVAVIVPFSEYAGTKAIKLGMLQGKASYKFEEDFDISDKEILGL